jgi:D-galacturonate reductase
MVKTVAEHKELVSIAREKGVLLQMEVHKRFDPIYEDARTRIQDLGNFGFFQSYMSQPKFQLQTFKEWAGISSDISYYLNSHHIDFHVWAMQDIAVPVSVFATASTGVAEKILDRPCEDTITLTVTWQNKAGGVGTAVYTASWVASKSDVHSQQRFFCLMEKAEVSVDQAHRGYSVAEDGVGYASCNPLFIRNKPDKRGRYVGQDCYGYRSFQRFVEAATQIRNGEATPADFDDMLPTGAATVQATAILEAGRRSLDTGRLVKISYDEHGDVDRLD